MSYDVAVIGTGNPDQSDGYAMAYRHARGYQRLPDCELIACADVIEDNAVAFAETFDIEETSVYEEYEAMLAAESPDIVSVCTPSKTHAEIVEGCANSGVLEAIHCEKPMAATWKGCRKMVQVCDRAGVQLTFNHQRRFAAPYRKAKSMVAAGRIGELERIEVGGSNLYDYGTHLFDMCGYVTDQTPIEWVLGQVDYTDTNVQYGLYQESEALARWQYKSGIDGFASTGENGLVDCEIRLVGTTGTIEIGSSGSPPLRIRTGSGWASVDTGRDGVWRVQPHPIDRVLNRFSFGPDRLLSDPPYVARAIADIVAALRDGSESELAAKNALQTTELVFACWESARRGGRVKLPIYVEENPLEAMVARGRVDSSTE